MNKRVAILIPDGIGIRNYLYSNVVKKLVDTGCEVLIWHNLPQKVISIAEQEHGIRFLTKRFSPKSESFLIRLLRESISFARLKLNAKNRNNPTILSNWNAKRNTLGKRILYPLAEWLGGLLHTYERIERTEKIYFSLIRKSKVFRKYCVEIDSLDIDVLFCTHQRASFVVAPMLAAQQLGIKTVTAIFSWDNLPKARLPMRVDEYFVWSKFMYKELLSYYPDISPAQIKITGTPQFDFYKKKDLIQSRIDFAQNYGLDYNKKWVLFSGDDKITSPYDPDYLGDIAFALRKFSDVQILFRQVPVEDTTRYDRVIEKNSNIIHIPPIWNKGSSWSSFFPLKGDISLLVNLANHCHTVVNVGSTMALDFAQFDRPGLYINYDQPHALGWSVETIYQFEHFRSMEGLDPVGWINAKEEIVDVIRRAIDEPDDIAPDRLKWKSRIVGLDDINASEFIARTLLEKA